MLSNSILAFLSVLILANANVIYILSPPALKQTYPNGIQAHVSPIGFRPRAGQLDGTVIRASPFSSCEIIQDLHSIGEDVFVLADDTKCLESVKAKNIANSGGYVGLIKQNVNNTHHDKQINLVHIPILELKPVDFDTINSYFQSGQATVLMSIDFTDQKMTHLINLQIWFSPTEAATYKFLLDIKDFITSQPEIISFEPHFVLQSQRETKRYVGCLSSGKYCPTEIEFEGKYEGKNIVEETLKQLIIWQMGEDKWWNYVNYFYKYCLKENLNIFLDSNKLAVCSESAMLISGVDYEQFKVQYTNSFLGNRIQVDDNLYLSEERQLYIKEQIESHPVLLINKKEVKMDVTAAEDKMCKMQGNTLTQICHAKYDNDISIVQLLIGAAVVSAIMIVILVVFKAYMYWKMKREIKVEVDKTLEQYYRYMDTFEGENGEVVDSKNRKKTSFKPKSEDQHTFEPKPVQKKVEPNDIDVEMNEVDADGRI